VTTVWLLFGVVAFNQIRLNFWQNSFHPQIDLGDQMPELCTQNLDLVDADITTTQHMPKSFIWG
jgi:hypothetical protein